MENKAVYIPEPLKCEIIDLPMPKPGPGEALLRVLYGGVCGSDFKVYLGKMNNVVYPKIAGHEFSGEIIEIGENDAGLKAGMVVTTTPYYGCGECYCCRGGFPNCCPVNKTMGVGCDGGFRNYVVVPVGKICDGKGIDGRTLALVEPFANSVNLVKRLDIRQADRVLIFGAGPIGTFAMLAAKMRGATVHLADTSDTRLAFARSMGADGTLNVTKTALADYVKEQTGGEGFGITVEAVGSGDVFKQCIEAVSFHGRVCVIGMTTQDFSFNSSVISFKEIEIVGARNSTRQDFLDIIDMVSSRQMPKEQLARMITKEYHFLDAPAMFKELESTYTDNMKVVVRFTG